jgi:hypothetical protein
MENSTHEDRGSVGHLPGGIMRRFSIRSVMAFIIVAGISLAAIRIGSAPWSGAMFSITFFTMVCSLLGVALTRGLQRTYWSGFADVRPMAGIEGRTVSPGPAAVPLSRGRSRFRRSGRGRLTECSGGRNWRGGNWWRFRWGLRGTGRPESPESAGVYPNRRGDRGAALGVPRRLGGVLFRIGKP